jgi:hypothetical protein
VTTDALAGARQALARGDVLIAYDDARRRLEAEPDDVEARWLVALTLARAGARERAVVEALRAQRDIVNRADATLTLREDVDALVARLAKDEALATLDASERQRLAARAAAQYETAADAYGRHYSSVNAATLWLLAGDAARSATRAKEARVRADDARADDPYWSLATDAEASLLLGDEAGARDALRAAAAVEPADQSARAVTRRQLRIVCDALAIDPGVVDALPVPTVVHYCGRMIDADWDAVRAEAAAFITRHNVGIAYGSLAWGSDLVIAEALLEAGVECNVVLPFAADEFESVSVTASGDWRTRYRDVLRDAHSVSYATDSAYCGDDDLFGFGSRLAMGRALNRAALFDADARQFAVWDGAPGNAEAGTAHDLELWRAAGRAAHVVRVPPATAGAGPAPAEKGTSREVRAILFADFRGFSRLRDEHFPAFVVEALGGLAHTLRSQGDACLWTNTWGDAIQAVFRDVPSAARAALALQETVRHLRLAEAGLPDGLALRIGGHAGPVRRLTEPLTGTEMFWGRELTRAARIEPTTPEGEVYVTDAFAALLALEPTCAIRCEYVGRVTTAKDFETIPMYRLRPTTAR